MRSFSVGLISVGLLGVLSISLAAQTRATVGGLTPAQQTAFNEGSRTFSKNYGVADGLGPVFNDESCNDCHRNGAGSNDTVTRFGRLDSRGVFDSLPELGGSLIQSRGIGSTPSGDVTHVYVAERTPSAATVTTLRRSHALLGLGFVGAVPDETWHAIARAEAEADPASAGRVHIVMQLTTGQPAVGKFGWKAQVPSLFQFTADALLNEMGITNPLFRDEVCPQGECSALYFNPAPAMNDDGRDVQALANFMTMLAAPTRGAITEDAVAGEQVFAQIGCANGDCAVPTASCTMRQAAPLKTLSTVTMGKDVPPEIALQHSLPTRPPESWPFFGRCKRRA